MIQALKFSALSKALAAALCALALLVSPAAAKSSAEIEAEVDESLRVLTATIPGARELYDRAAGVLVIPEMIKAGFIVGGAYGEGALRVRGSTQGYYSYGAASLGLQIGAQKASQVLFFMTQEALDGFLKSDGFELGVDAEVTVIDNGAGAALDSTKAFDPIIAVVFGRAGLLGGASLQGGRYQPLVR